MIVSYVVASHDLGTQKQHLDVLIFTILIKRKQIKPIIKGFHIIKNIVYIHAQNIIIHKSTVERNS